MSERRLLIELEIVLNCLQGEWDKSLIAEYLKTYRNIDLYDGRDMIQQLKETEEEMLKKYAPQAIVKYNKTFWINESKRIKKIIKQSKKSIK